MEKNEGILSDRAKKTAEKVKEGAEKAARYLKMQLRSVSGWIHQSNYHEWEKYKQQCQEYKVKMNPDGMELMIWLHNEITDAFYPIARASGLELVPFTKDRVHKFLEAIKNNTDWMNETDRLHDDIIKETDKNLVVHVKKK